MNLLHVWSMAQYIYCESTTIKPMNKRYLVMLFASNISGYLQQ